MLGLIAAGRAEGEAVRKGIRHLAETQLEDGGWDEASYTGTGFPRVFYMKYHLYQISFPLMALSRYHAAVAGVGRPAEVGAANAPGALACRIPAQPRPDGV